MDTGVCINDAGCSWREDSSDDFEYTANSSLEISPFRGFEKEPKVILERLNIEPFLIIDISKKLKEKCLNDTNKIFSQQISTCFVKLVKDDLDQLKKDVLENSRLNKIKTNGILSMPVLHCKICEKAYSSEKKLQNHLENKHMLVYKAGYSRKPQKRVSFSDHVVVHELKEYHRCRKCTRIYENYQSLKSHMRQEHRKRKCYICHYCSKNFVDRMFFKVHIKLHCDVCGLLLPNRHKYFIHRRDTCRVIKKYPCKTCCNFFFSYMDLKDHSYDHLENLFICDICKDQHSSKCAVSHHILFLHSMKRPEELYTSRNLGNERLYLCNFCEVSSIDRDVIEKHVSKLPDLNNRKRTGYKDYYFCDQCLRKFDTETDMLQHKWSHFLNTSDNSQVKSDTSIQRKSVLTKSHNERQKTFKINERLPNLMQPKIILDRVDYIKPQDTVESSDSVDTTIPLEETTEGLRNEDVSIKAATDPISEEVSLTKLVESTDSDSHVEIGVIVKKAIVDPKSKKTLISKFQCEKCFKYYSSNYCLNRHILSMHNDYAKLHCNVCEESFVWPSLLKSHNCIRMKMPEMPFDDARPEIQIDNYRDFGRNGFDELMNISDNEDYMNSVDFEIPAPIVEMKEYEKCVINPSGNTVSQNINYRMPVHSNSYKIIMQEVPIEF